MSGKVCCFYQVFKTRGKRNGDCSICTPDSKNKECSGYIPLTLYEVEVVDEMVQTSPAEDKKKRVP